MNDADHTAAPVDARLSPGRPRAPMEWVAFCAAAVVGVGVWIPTMAAHPRYSHGAGEDMGSASLWPLFMIAAVVLGGCFAREWQVIAGGLVLPTAALGLFTAPRGDNDGLWLLIIPLFVAFGLVLHILAGASGSAVSWFVNRYRKRSARTSKRPA